MSSKSKGLPPRAALFSIPLARPLMAAMLCAGILTPLLAAPQAPQTEPAPSMQTRLYAIPASSLAEALNRFSAESGIVLVFDAGALRGLNSKGVQGRFTLQTGFAALLADTGWEAFMTSSGGYALRPAKGAGREGGATVAETAPVLTPALPTVRAEASGLASVDALDREMLRNMPAINGDLTSQLKLNPNVQFSESQLSSYTGGEIAPAEISIHGAKPYQNEMLLDGVSIANDIDPGNKIVTTSPEFIPGAAQSLAIDSSILCEVDVKDSAVSAEYGRFTGGVVDAKICAARRHLAGSASVGYTSSGLTKLFVDPARAEAFADSSSADYQPHFQKWTYKGTLELRPIEGWGVMMNLVRQKSDIPLRRYTTSNAGSTLSEENTQHRVQDTLVIKSDFAPAGSIHSGDVTLVYAPSANSYFIEDYRDSDYTIKGGGLNLSARLESAFSPARLTQQLSYSQNEQSRRSDVDYYRNWRWSADKSWGDASQTNATSGEGAWGDVDQKIQTLNYKLKSAFKPMVLASVSHRISGGIELKHQQAEYERLKNMNYYLTVANLPTSGNISKCLLSDGSADTEACSVTPTIKRTVGQYFTRLMTYQAGEFDMSANAWAGYVEDEASWRNLILRVGARVDHDSLTKDANIGPRLKLSWQLSEPLSLDFGASRYYGRNLFGYALQEKVHTLLLTQTRSGTLTWGKAVQALPLNRLESINTPFDDELSAGLSYDSASLAGPVNLRFTRRDGHDQIVKRLLTKQADCNSSQCYIYTNNGRSVSQDWTLSWSSAKAFKLGPVVNRMWVAFNNSDVTSNYSTYADTFGTTQLNDAIIQYDGKFIRYSEIPADNYNRPWTLRVGAMSSLPSQQLTVTNILRVRDGYQQITKTGTTTYESASVDVYERTALPRSIALDTVIHWAPRIRHNEHLDVKLTVENLTNRKNKTTVSDTYATYERGRSIALELGYAF